MKHLIRFLGLCLFFSCLAHAAPRPTHADLRYSADYKRSTLDLWLPTPGDKPAPLVVLFHGGGFRYGNKTGIPYKKDFLGLISRGYAVASVGYPLLGDDGATDTVGPEDYEKIFLQTGLALTYLCEHAREYRIDPERIIVGGTSAGAMVAEYLTYKREFGIKACIAIQQPLAIAPALAFFSAKGPPLFLYTESGPRDKIHSPVYARAIKAKCDQLGIPAELYGTKRSGLPPVPGGRTLVEHVLSVLTPASPAADASTGRACPGLAPGCGPSRRDDPATRLLRPMPAKRLRAR